MKQGNWVPIDKRAIKFIPDDRPFSKAEALLSLQVAYDCKQDASLSRFAGLWKWSKGKVKRFLDEIGAGIEHKGKKHAPKNGTVTEQLRNSNGTLRFLCNKGSKRQAEQLQNAHETETGTGIKTKTKTKTKEKNFLSDSNEYRLAEFLFSKICERSPNHKKPNFEVWAKHVDYMLRIDKRPYEQISKLIEWVQMDSFWQDNVLSTSKLREKYDQLLLKMNSNGGKNGKNGQNNAKGSGFAEARKSGKTNWLGEM